MSSTTLRRWWRLRKARRAAIRSGVVSTDPIPDEDVARAAEFVREQGWVK